MLTVAWLLAALRSGGPYPLLAISGEQGSAKTVLSKLLKALIDPNAAPVRALPREERELMIAANNGYLLAFDNLSGLPVWLSDALCRLATGGSFAVRQLYTDDDEVLFEAVRPILLNGIEDVISRPDLGDRAVFLSLPPIGETHRRVEAELWREFEIARPRILGALLNSVVHGLRTIGRVHLDRLPRMADFALWAAACETALWPDGTFARAYAANRRAAIESIIEADPVATCVRAMMVNRTVWSGSASDLLRLCVQSAGDDISRGTAWAKNPRVLADRLRRAQTFLRTLGIEIAFFREGRTGTRRFLFYFILFYFFFFFFFFFFGFSTCLHVLGSVTSGNRWMTTSASGNRRAAAPPAASPANSDPRRTPLPVRRHRENARPGWNPAGNGPPNKIHERTTDRSASPAKPHRNRDPAPLAAAGRVGAARDQPRHPAAQFAGDRVSAPDPPRKQAEGHHVRTKLFDGRGSALLCRRGGSGRRHPAPAPRNRGPAALRPRTAAQQGRTQRLR